MLGNTATDVKGQTTGGKKTVVPQDDTEVNSAPGALAAGGVPSSSACVSAGLDEEHTGSASSAASDGKEIIIVRSNTTICPHIHCCAWSLLGCVLQRVVNAIELTHIGVLPNKARASAIFCRTGASARSHAALPIPRVLCLGAPFCERKTHWWTHSYAQCWRNRVEDIKSSSWDPMVVS